MIELNITAVIQFINFLITLVVLNYLLVTPIRKIIRHRAETMEKLQGAVNLAHESSDDMLHDYNKSLDAYRKEAALAREEIRTKAIVREREITETAQAEAQTKLQKARADINAQFEGAMAELKQKVPSLAEQAAARILT